MIHEKVGEVAAEAFKAAPPTVVVGLNILGYSISEWVQVATLVYIFLQMHVLAIKNISSYKSMWDYIKEVTRGKRKQK